ncbi:MAG: hypothetical protein EPO26_09065 [Chloroflexota bacterium]|nr:MAG: hypothetical protein EPO26_09065 [Chloroflexota bacterium]
MALAGSVGFGTRLRELELLRPPGPPGRGIGRSNSGADGGAPTNPNSAISVAQGAALARASANPTLSNPGVQGAAQDGPGGRIDVRI